MILSAKGWSLLKSDILFVSDFMKSKYRFCSVICFFSVLSPQSQPSSQGEMSRIEGTITRASSGAPLDRVEVTLSRKDRTDVPVLAVTDANGHFVIGGLDSGRYSIRVERSGYVVQIYGRRDEGGAGLDVILGRGQTLTGIDFQLVATGVITGRIVSGENEPLQGLNIEALRSSYIEGQHQFVEARHASTNDLGEYRIYGLAPGRYYLIAYEQDNRRVVRSPIDTPPKKRYIPTLFGNVTALKAAILVDVLEGAETSRTDITMLRSEAVDIRGRLATYLRPLPPFVYLNPAEDGTYERFQSAEAHVDMEGNFEFDGIIPGSYIVATEWIDKGRNVSARQRVEVRKENLEGLEVALNPGVDVKGRLRLQCAKDLPAKAPHARMRPMSSSASSAGWIYSTAVSADGTFLFLGGVARDLYEVGITGLAEDFYIESVWLGSQKIAHRTIDLTSSPSLTGLEIVVACSGGQVDGAVKDSAEKPAGGIVVTMVPDAGNGQEHYLFKDTVTDQNGVFALRGITPGDYIFFAWKDIDPGAVEDSDFLKPYLKYGERVTVGASERKTLQLRLTPISAQVH